MIKNYTKLFFLLLVGVFLVSCIKAKTIGQKSKKPNNETSVKTKTPINRENESPYISVSSGYTCVVKADSTVYCWGLRSTKPSDANAKMEGFDRIRGQRVRAV